MMTCEDVKCKSWIEPSLAIFRFFTGNCRSKLHGMTRHVLCQNCPVALNLSSHVRIWTTSRSTRTQTVSCN